MTLLCASMRTSAASSGGLDRGDGPGEVRRGAGHRDLAVRSQHQLRDRQRLGRDFPTAGVSVARGRARAVTLTTGSGGSSGQLNVKLMPGQAMYEPPSRG